LTLRSIESGLVEIDELRDLTCATSSACAPIWPDAGLEPRIGRDSMRAGAPSPRRSRASSTVTCGATGSTSAAAQSALRLAATLVHEVNHVINRSEVGYYDDLPTSAFIHEYRSFLTRRACSIPRSMRASIRRLRDHELRARSLEDPGERPREPLTPKLLPDDRAWRARRVGADVEELPAVCR